MILRAVRSTPRFRSLYIGLLADDPKIARMEVNVRLRLRPSPQPPLCTHPMKALESQVRRLEAAGVPMPWVRLGFSLSCTTGGPTEDGNERTPARTLPKFGQPWPTLAQLIMFQGACWRRLLLSLDCSSHSVATRGVEGLVGGIPIANPWPPVGCVRGGAIAGGSGRSCRALA